MQRMNHKIRIMVYFCAVNDVDEGSKFHRSVVLKAQTGEVSLWGVTELSSATFSKIKKDDLLLFYFKGSIIGAAIVLKTSVDKELSAKLWGTQEHRFKGTIYWSNVLYLSNYTSMKMSFSEIINICGYSNKFSVRRLISINQAGLNYINNNHNSEEYYFKNLVSNYGLN